MEPLAGLAPGGSSYQLLFDATLAGVPCVRGGDELLAADLMRLGQSFQEFLCDARRILDVADFRKASDGWRVHE